jgi:hypothetical protein
VTGTDDVEALAREIEQLRDEAADLIDQVAQLSTTGGAHPRSYPDWQTRVGQWLTPRISRRPNTRWCHHYAEHPEITDRLEALWHAWESTWPNKAARVAWFRDGHGPARGGRRPVRPLCRDPSRTTARRLRLGLVVGLRAFDR